MIYNHVLNYFFPTRLPLPLLLLPSRVTTAVPHTMSWCHAAVRTLPPALFPRPICSRAVISNTISTSPNHV